MPQVPRYVPYLFMLAFAAWCVHALHGDLAQLSLAPVLRAWDLVLLAAALSLCNYVLRTLRWRMYLGRLGHSVPLRFAFLTYTAGFAYTLSPGKVGEIVRARYYAPLGIPLSRVAAAFVAERFLDLTAMIVLAALLFRASSRYDGAIFGAGLLVALLGALALLPWSRLATAIESFSFIPRSLRPTLSRVMAAVASTRALMSPGLLLVGFVAGLLAWGLEGVGLGVLSSILPPLHLELPLAVGIYGAATLIGGLSFLPGGLGSTEAVMTALLVTQGYPVSQAVLVTLICRLVTLWLAVCLGWAAVFVLRHQARTVVTPWR